MSDLPKQVVAILVGDLHLSLKAPLARSAEPDWLAAQGRQLDELRGLWDHFAHCPILFAGDLFDRWNSPPELLNFALERLPPGVAVAGNHDLPNHSHGDIHRSAYWSLVLAGRIRNLGNDFWHCGCGVNAKGFPWGCELSPLETHRKTDYAKSELEGCLNITVVHKYCWVMGKAAAGMDKAESNAKYFRRKLKGFDVILTGDNHQSFIDGNLINPGSFYRRHSDERDHRPMVGLLTSKGKLVPYYLNCSQDKFIEVADPDNEVRADFHEFMDELERLEDVGMDFPTAVRRALETTQLDQLARQVVLGALETAIAKQEK